MSGQNVTSPRTHTLFPQPPPHLLSQAEVSRLQNELENSKTEAAMQQQRSKAELEEAQRVNQRITKERDDLLATIEQLNKVPRGC